MLSCCTGGRTQDGLRLISQEIFDLSLPNLKQRSTRVRQRPSSNRVTLISFSRSKWSFKAAAYERWFPLNISRNIWCILSRYSTQEHQGNAQPNSNLVTLASFPRSQLLFKRMAYKIWFCSVSQEIFDVSSQNLVHRSIRARRRSSSNQVTVTSFCHKGHLKSFEMVFAEYLKSQ